jgi:DNA-binding LacI/PurR family transcriptional regulator
MITLQDVAKAAGVSRVTASFVMNGREQDLKISQKTLEKVKATAQRLGYCRNEIAYSMKTGQTNPKMFVCPVFIE